MGKAEDVHVTISESEQQQQQQQGGVQPEKKFGRQKIVDGMKEHWSLILKVLQLILSIVCVGLIEDAVITSSWWHQNNGTHSMALAYSTFSSYIIILCVILLGRVLGETLEWRMSAMFSTVGTILFGATAIVLLLDWSNARPLPSWQPTIKTLDLICASGSIAVVTCAIFLLDTILTCRRGYSTDE